jgi:hypothetical protein
VNTETLKRIELTIDAIGIPRRPRRRRAIARGAVRSLVIELVGEAAEAARAAHLHKTPAREA